MSFLTDLFSNNAAQQASNAYNQQLNQGLATDTGLVNQGNQQLNTGLANATGNINQGNQQLTSNYASALAPYTQNYSQAQSGVNQLGNVLGLNGAAGSASALSTLQNTPGYQFQLQQGDNAVNAAAAANGTLNSGNQDIALSNYNQGLAGTTYNNYVSQLQPYLNASNSAAGGIASTNTGLGNALNSNSTNLANANLNTAGALNTNSNTLGAANLGVSSAIGNSIANAENSANSGTNNLMSLLGGAAKLGTSIFSDARLKEDIETVGELFDGQRIYSYTYKGDDVPRIGLMAQDVERLYPDAVKEFGGFKAVDYGKATRYASALADFLDAA